MATQPDLSIIIVNWNSAAFVMKCLSTIYENTKALQFEVIVVDNASHDGCDTMIAKDFSAVRFIQSHENSGFARANNLGFMHSCGRNVLFLNPDTELVGPAIDKLVHFLDLTPQAGVLGARLLNSDRSVQTSCIQRYPTILNQVLDADFLRDRFHNWSFWGTRALFDSPEKPAPVEVVSGACQMIRRGVFEQVGFYDPGYFMYAEDVDLCFKAQHAGWTNYYVGDALVIHHGGQSTGAQQQSNFAAVMMRKSLARFFRERHGRVSEILYRTAMGVVSLCRVGSLAVLMVITLGFFRRERLSATMAKWLRVFRWAIGLETLVKLVTPRVA
jgi:GT2 family glycosyltransferase